MSRPALTRPILCLVTDRRLCHDGDLVRKVAQAVEGGVNMVQLREKDMPGGGLLKLTMELKNALQNKALLFINERVDVALACSADGVQLGEDAMGPSEVRQLVKDTMLIGRSVHSMEGALAAQRQGVDLLVVGTIFPSPSHPAGPVSGAALLRRLTARIATPCIGIGGINAANAAGVIHAGALGVAVISAILSSPNPRQAAAALRQAINAAWASRQGLERVSKR
ncbi:MAG: thiamine phosphate synthase [SAR202 cluster bacterium]|nr:thiamine phosphate synthase [SAR202 cluster bacterium]